MVKTHSGLFLAGRTPRVDVRRERASVSNVQLARVQDLVGKALPHLHETGDFDIKRQGISSYDLDRCVGCGQRFVVCRDAGGQAIEWDAGKRRPRLTEDKCLSCMICSFVCPVPDIITFKEMPRGWKRRKTLTLG